MRPETLLSISLPLHLQPPPTPNQPSLPTLLQTTLTYSHPTPSLTLTLSDLSQRLLLLNVTLTPTLYAPIRATQCLRVDFPAFPAHLVALLRRPLTNHAFALQLHIKDGEEEVRLKVVEITAYKDIMHLELPLRRASGDELVAALAERVREGERAASEMAGMREELQRNEVEIARLVSNVGELEQKCEENARVLQRAERAEGRIIEMEEEVRGYREELDGLREGLALERSRAEQEEENAREERKWNAERVKAAVEEEKAEGQRIVEELRRELDEARREGREMRAQVGRENGELERLKEEVRVLKAKGKVKGEVIRRQEGLITREESKSARMEREIRRGRDRVRLLEVENEGLRGRLQGAERKLEESQEVLRSDSRVIAYLNRELNEKVVRDEVGGVGTGGVGRVGDLAVS